VWNPSRSRAFTQKNVVFRRVRWYNTRIIIFSLSRSVNLYKWLVHFKPMTPVQYVIVTPQTLYYFDAQSSLLVSHQPMIAVLDEKYHANPLSAESLIALQDQFTAQNILVCNNSVQLSPEKLALLVQHIPAHMDQDVARVFTQQYIASSVTWDVPVIQAVRLVEELDKTFNLLVKRLRDWFNWQYPDASQVITTHEHFVTILSCQSVEQIIERIGEPNVMGTPYNPAGQQAVWALVTQLQQLTTLRESTAQYIQDQMTQFAPNYTHVAGSQVGAKILSLAGSMRRLTKMPASTLQVMGAEKALFRHLKTGARPPKYGILFQHSLVQKGKEKGRIARQLANVLSIAVKVDYFGGQFIGEQLLAKVKA